VRRYRTNDWPACNSVNTCFEWEATCAAGAPVQVVAGGLFARLAEAGQDRLVPIRTVLRMAENALGSLPAPQSLRLDVLMNALAVLKCEGMWQQLEPEKAVGLSISALELVGAQFCAVLCCHVLCREMVERTASNVRHAFCLARDACELIVVCVNANMCVLLHVGR
jgi:hypothetical protein